MLAALLLSVVGLGGAVTLVQVETIPGFASRIVPIGGALLVLSLAYVSSRTRFYPVGAAVATATPALACVATGAQNPDDRVWYGFMLITVVLATLFFSLRMAAVTAFGLVVTLCLMPIWVPELRAPARIIPVIALHAVLSPLLLVAARHRAHVERESQAELRRMDARLAELERLEALARSAEAAAHDFNNLLTVISANSAVLEAKLPAAAMDSLAEIRMAVDRASELGKRIVGAARDSAVLREKGELAAVVRSFEPLLVRLAGGKIKVRVSIAARLPAVAVDVLALERALMNLATNARDAMADGGSFTIDCRRVVLDQSYARAHAGAVAGEHVVIEVSDTGAGIEAGIVEHVFDPFFTTKEPDRGTGLGLAIVREVVAQHGGHVTVTSEVGAGTTFRVYLPVTPGDAALPPGLASGRRTPSIT